MQKTRRQRKNKSGENANIVPASAEIESIPPQTIASTSVVSVVTRPLFFLKMKWSYQASHNKELQNY